MTSDFQRVFSVMLALMLLIYPTHSYAGDKVSLDSAYQQVVDSFLGSTMILHCGHEIFKITSGIISTPKLFWKSGLEWVELEDANFKDTGIVFRGLGKEGGVPLEKLIPKVELPIFNSGTFFNSRTAQDYLAKSRDTEFVPYEYSIDMLQATMTSKNLTPIVDYLTLDAEKYIQEQSRITVSVDSISNEQIKEEELNKKKSRMDTIAVAVNKYVQEIMITTPALSYEITDYCSLEQ